MYFSFRVSLLGSVSPYDNHVVIIIERLVAYRHLAAPRTVELPEYQRQCRDCGRTVFSPHNSSTGYLSSSIALRVICIVETPLLALKTTSFNGKTAVVVVLPLMLPASKGLTQLAFFELWSIQRTNEKEETLLVNVPCPCRRKR